MVLKQNKSHTHATFQSFRSTNHVLKTVEITKLCLCAFDDKRYILENGVNALAYGNYTIYK